MMQQTQKEQCKKIRLLWSNYLHAICAKKATITEELRDICRELYSVKIGIQPCDEGYTDSCQDIVNKMKKCDPDAELYIQEADASSICKCSIM